MEYFFDNKKSKSTNIKKEMTRVKLFSQMWVLFYI